MRIAINTRLLLKGKMDGPLLYAGYGRAVLVGEDGAVLRRWNGCGNVHCVRKTAEHRRQQFHEGLLQILRT